jgi:hypothetical protein
MDRVDRGRLAKLCGMLGSSHDGESLAAGRAADALIRHAGLTWPSVLEPQVDPVAEQACRQLLAENEALQRQLGELYAQIGEIAEGKALHANPAPMPLIAAAAAASMDFAAVLVTIAFCSMYGLAVVGGLVYCIWMAVAG